MSLNRSKFLEPNEDSAVKSMLPDSRDKLLIILGRATGARASELLLIRKEDLYIDTNTVFIRGLKGSRDREIPITSDLMRACLKYIPFNIKYRRLEQIWRSYRPCNKKFHSLRHTFAISLYRRTKDIKLTQLALGHRSLTNTQIYMDFVMTQEEMKRILE